MSDVMSEQRRSTDVLQVLLQFAVFNLSFLFM